MADTKIAASLGSPSSPQSSPSSRPASPTRGLRRPASHGRLAKLMLPGRSRSSSSASASNEVVYADDTTPITSGRTTPEQRRRSGKAAASSLLASDAKYKKFAGLVDKSLQSFESVNEWADFISFLSRLLKTLQSPSPPYAEIPRKLIVSKRLAQCLNPALPSGVHQRALEVYSYIFSTIGTEGLRRDLLIWSSGLFPFFQYAATSVRPMLINLYESYYLPLGDDLRPATKALVLALLPGMEEETGDFFDRVYSLFGRLSDAVSPAFLQQNIFLILISSPSSRLAALNYLSKALIKTLEVVKYKSDVGLIVRGVAAVLQDETMLVRRTGLDLLLRILPIDGSVYSESDAKDRELLMRAACAVVLQREISLSRRVFTWLLGKEESPEKQIAYFRTYGLELLARVLRDDMNSLGVEPQLFDAHRPFKVFLSLLDRWEIGASLSDKLVIPALDAIRTGIARVSPSMREEMLDTATAVYEAVEPIVIWRTVFASLEKQDTGSDPALLLTWLVTSIRQRDGEVCSLHAPVISEYLLRRYSATSASAFRQLDLAARLLDLVSPSLLSRSADQINDESLAGKTDTDMTSRLYGAANPNLVELAKEARERLPVSIVTTLFHLSSTMIGSRQFSDQALLSILGMISSVLDAEAPALKNVPGRAWLGRIVKALPSVRNYALVDGLVSIVLKASRCPALEPQLQVSEASVMTVLLDTLLRFLRSQSAPLHARVVELLWECNQLAQPHTLENVVASRLADPIGRCAAFEAFGVLWRLTDDSMLSRESFYTPILAIADGLDSSDPVSRHRTELWLRQNLQSPYRLIDPILSRLFTPSQDLDAMAYLLRTLSNLFSVISPDELSSLSTRLLSQSVHPAFQSTIQSDTLSYLDVVLDVAVSKVEIDMTHETIRSDLANAAQATLRIQSSALTLMRRLVEHGDSSATSSARIRDCLVASIRRSIRQSRLALQPQMLALLQQCISPPPSSPHMSPSHHRKRSQPQAKPRAVSDSETDLALIQVVIEGVTSPQNRSLLQQWVDFVLAISPAIGRRQTMILMLCECFSDQLRRVVVQLRAAYQSPSNPTVADSEPALLLSALERLISLVFAPGRDLRASEESARATTEGAGSGIMGLVSGVFTVEAPANDKVSDSIQYLDDAISALLLTWSVTGKSYASGSAMLSEAQVLAKTRAKAREVLDQLFRAHASAVIGSCIQVWAAQSPDIDDEAIFDCIDHLAPSAQKVVEIVADVVNGRHAKANEPSSDPAILGFLEVYVSRLEAPIAVQIWNTLFAFAREVHSSSNQTSKLQLFPVLRCVTIVCKTVSTTSALEDRRLRRDLQDVYLKLLDGVVSNAAKAAESALWRRDSSVSDKASDKDGGVFGDDGLSTLHEYIAGQVVPNLRSFLADNDKVGAAAANIASGLLQPAFRRQRVDGSVLQILLELAKLPSATKSWRLQVGEAFNDQRFFRINIKEAARWKRLISALMDSDKERFGELLARITAAPSANIFTNREQEMISRSLNLRRLSFVLLAAERNHHLAQLPSIQEKLVDILRTDVVSPRVHSEVYLCLRVLMCRISPQHLTNFWPVILTELLKVFEGTMDDPPADGSEDLSLILAACKFLDLLLIIQSEDFQVHQWMFVTDTTDAAFPPEDFVPEAIMDRLSEIMSEHRHTSTQYDPVVLETYDNESQALRKPRLTAIRQLSSLYQLQPFFARASIDTFEGVYGNQGVDWEAIETGLDYEIFEGQA